MPMYKNRTTKLPQKTHRAFSLRPFVVGMILIFVITAFFIYKNKREENSITLKKEQLLKKSQEVEYVEVDLATSKEVYKAIGNSDFQLIDIREPAEFRLKHIESSINIPLSTLEEDVNLINKKLKIIVIDREDSSYGRILTDHLKKQGLNAKYLKDGILNFSNEGYPLITEGSPINAEDLMKVTSLTIDRLLEMTYQGERFALVDTRNSSDFNGGNIPGSINVPLEELEKRKNELPSKNLLLYDNDTMRSFQAAVRLHDMGMLRVYNCLSNYETLSKRLEEEMDKTKKQPGQATQENQTTQETKEVSPAN